MVEANIRINDVELSFAQSMSVRVAVASMLMDLADPEYMKALGKVGPLYQSRLSEVQRFLLLNQPRR